MPPMSSSGLFMAAPRAARAHTLAWSFVSTRSCGVAHEFRTTVVAPHLDLGRLREMGRLVRGSRWLLQEARTGPGPKKDWTPVPKQVLCAWAQELRAAGIDAMVRGEEQQG